MCDTGSPACNGPMEHSRLNLKRCLRLWLARAIPRPCMDREYLASGACLWFSQKLRAKGQEQKPLLATRIPGWFYLLVVGCYCCFRIAEGLQNYQSWQFRRFWQFSLRHSATSLLDAPCRLRRLTALSYAQTIELNFSTERGLDVIVRLVADRHRISLLPAPGNHPGSQRAGVPTA